MKTNVFKSEPRNDRFIMQDTRDTRDSRDARDARDSRDSRDARDARDARDSRDRFRNRRHEEPRSGNAFGVAKRVKEKDITLNLENFPELTEKVETHTTEENIEEINYASALNKVKEEENIDALQAEKVPPGWVRIGLDSNRKLKYEYGEQTYKSMDERTLNEEMNDAIELMKERWIRHKENYIELYGEDAYEKYYGTYSYSDYETELDSEEHDY